jgi:spermidine/putrescine-binding protein
VVDGDLVIASWAQYVDPELLNGFEADYGVAVAQSHFDSMDGLLGRLRARTRSEVATPTPGAAA